MAALRYEERQFLIVRSIRVSKLSLTVVALSAFMAVPVAAQTVDEVNARIDMLLGEHAAYEQAFGLIQAAVAADEAAAVAQWVAYPFSVTADGKQYSFDGPDGFIEHYSGIVTEEVKAAIVDQQYEELFVSADGIMFGDGQLWLNGICADEACSDFEVKIIAIQSTAAN